MQIFSTKPSALDHYLYFTLQSIIKNGIKILIIPIIFCICQSVYCGEAVPFPKFLVSPFYPNDAIANNENGFAKIRITIDSNGFVKSVHPLTKRHKFTKSAIKAIKQWKFFSAGEFNIEFKFIILPGDEFDKRAGDVEYDSTGIMTLFAPKISMPPSDSNVK